MGQCTQKNGEVYKFQRIDRIIEQLQKDKEPSQQKVKSSVLSLAEQLKNVCNQYMQDKSEYKMYMNSEMSKLKPTSKIDTIPTDSAQKKSILNLIQENINVSTSEAKGKDLESVVVDLQHQIQKTNQICRQNFLQLSFQTTSLRQYLHELQFSGQRMQGAIHLKLQNLNRQIQWITKHLEVKIDNLNFDFNIKTSNLEEKIGQKQTIETIDEDQRRNSLPKSLASFQHSSQWVHKQCYFYEKIRMDRNYVKYQSSGFSPFAFVFGANAIENKFKLNVKIDKINQRVAIGLADSRYIKKYQLSQRDNNWLFYFSNGQILGQGNIVSNIKKRQQYKEGDIIGFNVQLSQSKVQWTVNGKISCVYYWKTLKDTTLSWLPCLYLSKECSLCLI